ncbi:MAG: capsular polysaccharide synthesis protein [Muribaculum sp.]|nr:capsular polysaccharide synthesis protein [Muribaculum sp.]
MDTKRFKARIRHGADLIVRGHILNPVWKSHDYRRRRRYSVTIESAMKYFQLYKPYVQSLSPSVFQEKKEDEPQKERVFTLWFQGEDNAPAIVKSCLRSMRRHLKQELIVIDEKTLFDWISLPEEIILKWKSGKMCNANFSDICRLELLYRYGGVWMDATDFVTAPIPDYIIDSDFFLFKTGERYGKWFSFIESCFIRARRGNRLLAIWHDTVMEYWKHENSAIDYFVNLMLFRFVVENNKIAADLYAKMPKTDHSLILDFWRYYGDKQFDYEEFKHLMSNSFMKKTSYHTRSAENTIPGSFAEHVINS